MIRATLWKRKGMDWRQLGLVLQARGGRGGDETGLVPGSPFGVSRVSVLLGPSG